ncbi:MAG: LbetaH domain-containing protein [Planctomycetota bacterium]
MFDDFLPAGTMKHNRPILGNMESIPALFKNKAFEAVSIGVGYKSSGFRKKAYEYLKAREIPVVTFIHPSSHVEASATIGDGSIVLVNCTVDMNARISENVLLSSRSFISHDVRIGSHTYCGPAVKLAGHTDVGECCFLGINTTSIDGVKIGSNVQTAAGAVVTKEVPPDVLVAGVPAIIKKSLMSE